MERYRENVLVRSQRGRNISELHQLEPETKRVLEEFLHGLVALEGSNLRRVVLFGSQARGDFHDESDVDVYIVLNEGDEDKHCSEIISLSMDTASGSNPFVLLSPFVRTVEHLNRPFNDKTNLTVEQVSPIYQAIAEEGIILYDVEP